MACANGVQQFHVDGHRVNIIDIEMSKTPEEVLNFLKLKSVDDLFTNTDDEGEIARENEDKFLVHCVEKAEKEEEEDKELV